MLALSLRVRKADSGVRIVAMRMSSPEPNEPVLAQAYQRLQSRHMFPSAISAIAPLTDRDAPMMAAVVIRF
jgi:hypothetical protein